MSVVVPDIDLIYIDENRTKFVGKQIQNARKAKGYKSCDLAKAVGIGKDQMSKIENGYAMPKIDNLCIIAQYLDLDLNFLMFGNEGDAHKNKANELLESLDDEQLKRAELILQAAFGEM